MAESVNERVTRLEYLMGVLADKQAKLDDVVVVLAAAQTKTEARFRKTDGGFRRRTSVSAKRMPALKNLW